VRDLTYQDDGQRFVDALWAEAYAASVTLEYLGYLRVQAFLGHNLKITSTGREPPRDASELATANVAPDALRELIVVEDVMEKRAQAGGRRY
jgi:hypothetical protein